MTSGIVGDFNGNSQLDPNDVDLMVNDHLSNREINLFDLNQDGQFDLDDQKVWVHDAVNTYFGDANLDGEFNSSDLVSVFEAGEYEDAIAGNSGWAKGDWNGDGEFTTADFVLAFEDGGYEQGPRAALIAVPEPTSGPQILALLLACSFRNIDRQRAAEAKSAQFLHGGWRCVGSGNGGAVASLNRPAAFR